MPRFKGQVSSFAAGELSPEAQDRMDSAVWQAGAETLENVLVKRGGGVQTRPGIRLIRPEAAVGQSVTLPDERNAFASGLARVYAYQGVDYPSGLQGVAASGSMDFAPDSRAVELSVDRNTGDFDWRQPAAADVRDSSNPWSIPIDRANAIATADRNAGRFGFRGTIEGHAIGSAASIAGTQWQQDLFNMRRYAMALLRIDPPPWPLKALELRNVLPTLSRGPALAGSSTSRRWWTQWASQLRPASPSLNELDATRRLSLYPRHALWGCIAGDTSGALYPLTGMGPYASDNSSRDPGAHEDNARGTGGAYPLGLIGASGHTAPLRPGATTLSRALAGDLSAFTFGLGWEAGRLTAAQLDAMGCTAYLVDANDQAWPAYEHIYLVQLLSRSYTIPRNEGAEAGRVTVTAGGASAVFNVDETRPDELRGTNAGQEAIEALSNTPAVTTNTGTQDVRLEAWSPTPETSYLVQLSRDKVVLYTVGAVGQNIRTAAVLDLPRAKNALVARTATAAAQRIVEASFPDALPDVDQIAVVPAGERLYLFHEDIAPSLVIRADGELRIEQMGVKGVSRLVNKTDRQDIAIPRTPGAPYQNDEGVTLVPPSADAADGYWENQPGQGIRSGAFAFGRLCLFGSGKHPSMIAFSKVNDPDTFVPVEGGAGADPDQPFHALTAGGENLHGAIEGRRLIVFGQQAEYFLPSEELSGRRLAFRKTSQHGSPRGGRALNVGDAVVFRQADPSGAEGVDVRMMVFSDEESGFRTPSLAPFSPHMVQGVTDMAYQPGGGDGSARLWCVKSDGTMSVLSIDRAAQVNAWSRITAPLGVRIEEVATVGDRLFLLVRGNELALAEMSYDPRTGSVLDFPRLPRPTRNGSRLQNLVFGRSATELPEIMIVSDKRPAYRYPLSDTERAGGRIDLLRGSADAPGIFAFGPEFEDERLEVGIPIRWTVRTLPFVPRTATGSAIAVQKSRVVRTMIDFVVEGDPVLLPVQRLQELESYLPGRVNWPRRIDIEDSRGLWLPFICIPFADTEGLMRVKLGARRGWRNRTTVAIRGDTPATLAGLSWMVAGSGG